MNTIIIIAFSSTVWFKCNIKDFLDQKKTQTVSFSKDLIIEMVFDVKGGEWTRYPSL